VKKEFELISYTADVGIRARGKDLPEAFSGTARGLFSLITDLSSIKEVTFRDVKISAADPETLLVDWLNELVFLFDTEMLLFGRFQVEISACNSLTARCWGEKADRTRHSIKRGIKAATLHNLKVEQLKNGAYQVQVLIDI
jgi:SHS2 domain-containing protein